MNEKELKLVEMVKHVKSITDNETDIIANLSNISSVLNSYLENINWVGFYILKDNQLVLGPFQGKPACIRIKLGNGVCGTAAEQNKIIIVDNVHEFPGHIACDENSKSEIVLPIYHNNILFGVLDVDSPDYNNFDKLDEKYLIEVCEIIKTFVFT